MFFLHVLLFSAFPLLFTLMANPQRQVHFYVYISLILLIGGFLGNAYSFPLTEGIVISGGNVCYGAFMMTAVLFVLTERDIFILRRLVRLVVLVDVFNILFSILATRSLSDSGIINPHQTPAALFQQSTPLIVLGGILIILELLFLLYVFEYLKRFRLNTVVTGAVYVVVFVLVLCFDGIAFPFIAFGFSPEIVAIVFGGLSGKVIAAACFSVPLVIYMILSPKRFSEYLETDVFSWRLLVTPSSSLLRELAENERRLEQADVVFRNSNEGLAILDLKGNLVRTNEAFDRLVSLDGQSRSAPEFRRAGKPVDIANLKTGEWRGEVEFGHAHEAQGILAVSPVSSGGNGEQTFVCSLTDITEQKKARDSLDYLAMHDPLTDLPNRRALDKALNDLGDEAASLVVLDLDGFKDLNDSFGPAFADQVLREVAERLLSVKKSDDFPPAQLFRLGGDKFALLFELTDTGSIRQAIGQAKAGIARSIHANDGIEIILSAMSGVSLKVQGETSDLLKEAVSALHEAKRTKRSTVEFYEERYTLDAQRRQSVSLTLKKALDNGELEVFYQPQVDFASNRIVGAEALARWPDPAIGPVSPVEFIPVAEETGLINPLGLFVLNHALRTGARIAEQTGTGVRMSVNVSAHQLRSGNFDKTVENILAETGFPAELLELELTESAYLERNDDAEQIFRRLKDLGISIAIDDFGTGYSSLSILQALPWDTLKIDRSFVSSLPQKHVEREFVAGIIQIARSMSLQVVAEGVETGEQFDFLKSEGCNVYQGFLCSPAVSSRDFLTLLDA